MPKQEKIDLVNSVADKLRESQSIILTDFKGMTVEEVTNLRAELRKSDIEMRVVKNRLLKIALSEAEFESVDDLLVGNTAVSFGVSDPVAPAKILAKYAETNAKLVIKGGHLTGKALDADGVVNLSKMPSREELLSKMAGVVKQPPTKMAQGFKASITKVALAFNALAAKMEEAA